MNATKNGGWTQVIWNGRQFLLHVRHPSCKKPGDNSWIVLYISDRNDSLFVGVIVSSVVELWFDPLSVQTKDYKHDICFFSIKYPTLRSKSKTG